MFLGGFEADEPRTSGFFSPEKNPYPKNIIFYLINFDKRDFLRAALFFFITPFCADLSIA